MTSPVGGRRHELGWVRAPVTATAVTVTAAATQRKAFRPEQLRTHLALRLRLV